MLVGLHEVSTRGGVVMGLTDDELRKLFREGQQGRRASRYLYQFAFAALLILSALLYGTILRLLDGRITP